MATFKLRESGLWQAQIRRKGHPQQSQTFITKSDAEKWARQIENEIDRGVFVSRAEAEATTLFSALERYKREVSRLKKGYEQERYVIAALRQHKLAKRSLASLKSSDVAAYRDELLAGGLAAATVRLRLALLSHLFTTASSEWNIPVVNPIANVRAPRADNSRERRLDGDEETRLLVALGDSGAGERANVWILPVVVFAIETGARQSEIISLVWKDVDLDRRVARIRGIDGRSLKNDDTYRDVPLSSRAIETLRALPRAIGGKVFPTTASAIKQSWMRACKRAEIENLHFHDLRHEATSRLAEIFALHELMKITGHKDTRMLARYYHPRAEDLAKKLG
jgi:integrase